MSREKLEQVKNKWEEKLAHFEYELAITADAGKKFELREEIKQCEEEISRIKARLESIVKNDELKNSSFNFESTEHEDNLLGEIKLLSNKKIDYTQLRNLLAAGNWKEADLETCRIMLKISNRGEKGWLDNESILNLPCQDLLTVDRLWVKYSRGRFGFSVQQQIWQEINESTLIAFAERVGWRVEGNWLIDYHSDFTFSLNASKGHLPCFATWCDGWIWGEMWQKEFGSSGRLAEIFSSTVFHYTSFIVNDWNSNFFEKNRRKSISALMSRLKYCNSLLESNNKQSYFIWVFFLLFSSCLVSLFLIQA